MIRQDIITAVESVMFLAGNIAFAYVGFSDGALNETSSPVNVLSTSSAWSMLS